MYVAHSNPRSIWLHFCLISPSGQFQSETNYRWATTLPLLPRTSSTSPISAFSSLEFWKRWRGSSLSDWPEFSSITASTWKRWFPDSACRTASYWAPITGGYPGADFVILAVCIMICLSVYCGLCHISSMQYNKCLNVYCGLYHLCSMHYDKYLSVYCGLCHLSSMHYGKCLSV